MSSPVITVVENVSLAEAQLLMLKHNVTHLCVTQDGTDKSDLKGVISEHDLIAAQANNPVLIKEIKRSQNPKETNTRTFNRFDSDFNFKTYRYHMYSHC
jgi:CBS domain-containing protein